MAKHQYSFIGPVRLEPTLALQNSFDSVLHTVELSNSRDEQIQIKARRQDGILQFSNPYLELQKSKTQTKIQRSSELTLEYCSSMSFDYPKL